MSEVLVGRTLELERLEQALKAAGEGRSATVLVSGEAGIGKTRLASELAGSAREAGFEILLGHAIDLVGTELPYQPFVEALRPLGELRRVGGEPAASQLALFEQALALLAERSAAAPVLVVLEDLHWADTSTLDLVVFLAHNLGDQRVLLVATCREDEHPSGDRIRRLTEGVRRSGRALVLELGPLEAEELTALLAARGGVAPSRAVARAIVERADGNPFFAEELLAASGANAELPRNLRNLLLERVAELDDRVQNVLRLAAAAGRDVAYPLLQATSGLAEDDLRAALRQAVEHGVLTADQARSRFRFRHALQAEAIYSTILPGEREELHARLAEQLAARDDAEPAELAPHWAAAGRADEALAASVAAAREAESVFGLAEAFAHLERAVDLWSSVANAADVVQVEEVDLVSWTAELAANTGEAPRAVELGKRAIELVGDGDGLRAAALYLSLGRYVHANGEGADALVAACERAVELIPADPPSPERAQALAALGQAYMIAWRTEEARWTCEQALTLARSVGARSAELRALAIHGAALVGLGGTEEGLAELREALHAAEELSDPVALHRAYIFLTDALELVGRPRESADLAEAGLEAIRPYGMDTTTLLSNQIEALVDCGEWDEADRVSADAIRTLSATYPYQILYNRAVLEIGRGDFGDAHAHLEAVVPNIPEDFARAAYDTAAAELALWERRWAEAEEAVSDGLDRIHTTPTALIRVQLCALGVRAQAELTMLARARRDSSTVRLRLGRARRLADDARDAAAIASAVTPKAGGWLALATAEHERARGESAPETWSSAAAIWDELRQPALTAYCRWREAEALVGADAPRTESTVPLRDAHAIAIRLGAKPLVHEIELLAERARIDLTPNPQPEEETRGFEELGLTAREAEVLTLVARGYTNREIASALVISVKTASVHVSHILRKLDAPNRREAAAIAHRLAPPPGGRRETTRR